VVESDDIFSCVDVAFVARARALMEGSVDAADGPVRWFRRSSRSRGLIVKGKAKEVGFCAMGRRARGEEKSSPSPLSLSWILSRPLALSRTSPLHSHTRHTDFARQSRQRPTPFDPPLITHTRSRRPKERASSPLVQKSRESIDRALVLSRARSSDATDFTLLNASSPGAQASQPWCGRKRRAEQRRGAPQFKKWGKALSLSCLRRSLFSAALLRPRPD